MEVIADEMPPIVFEFGGRYRLDIRFFNKKTNLTYIIFQPYFSLKRLFKPSRNSKAKTTRKSNNTSVKIT